MYFTFVDRKTVSKWCLFIFVGGSRYQPGRGGASSGEGGASLGGTDPFTG